MATESGLSAADTRILWEGQAGSVIWNAGISMGVFIAQSKKLYGCAMG